MTDQLTRCGLLLQLLNERSGCTKMEMVSFLENQTSSRISHRTLDRDLEMLRSHFHCDVKYDYRSKLYELQNVNNASYLRLQAIIAARAQSRDLAELIEILDDPNSLIVRRPANSYVRPKHLLALARCIRNKVSVRLQYRLPWRKETEEITVHPYHLVCHPGFWNCICWSEKDNLYLNLSVESIEQLNPDSNFVPNLDHDLINVKWTPSFDPFSNPESYGSTLRFSCSESLYRWFLIHPPSSSIHFVEKSDKNLFLFEVSTENPNDWNLLLSTYLYEIDILEPKKLREEVHNHFGKLFQRYA